MPPEPAAPATVGGPVNLIWQCDGRHFWEVDWIRALFAGVPHRHHVDAAGEGLRAGGRYGVVLPRSVVIESGIHTLTRGWTAAAQCALDRRRTAYYRCFDAAGHARALVHISDEQGRDAGGLGDAGFAFVLRNYGGVGAGETADAGAPPVRRLPLGYGRGLVTDAAATPASARPLVWSFMGTVWPGGPRADMLRALGSLGPNLVHETRGFNNQAFGRAAYSRRLCESRFVPCPPGDRAFETFRLYEALECGAVPVTDRGADYARLLGPVPFPCVADWAEAAERIAALDADPAALDALARRCRAWWRDLKASLAAEVTARAATL